MEGVVRQAVVRGAGDATYAVFLLPNFESVIGRGVSTSTGAQSAARLVLAGGGWKITLDGVERPHRPHTALRANSGFAVTHVGKVERVDGGTFTAEEGWKVLDALGWYLSFCSGRWNGPGLLRGFDASGQQVWQVWGQFRTVPYQERQSWADPVESGCVEGPFPGFLKLWGDEDWQEAVRMAIHWFIEANAQAGSIEGAIVLTLTALELLASVVLVENLKRLSVTGSEKLGAVERIRELISWAGVPHGIPPALAELTRAARSENWLDAPTALVKARNMIVHPTRQNREKYGRHSGEVGEEVWRLGRWVLELCLLRLFD